MRKTRKLLALVLAASLLAVACTSPEADEPPDEELEAAGIAHAECMRQNGYDWPDPVPVDGGFDIRPPKGIDTASTRFEEAEAECRAVYEAALPDVEVSPDDRAFMEEEMERMLVFAQCMRDQGIDFPDPQIEGGAISGPAGPLDGDWGTFDSARAICEEETGAPMP
jgi:hypothetical protein